jgi:hypothetical protein
MARYCVLVVFLGTFGCDPAPLVSDGGGEERDGGDAAVIVCTADRQCSNDTFCDGLERCMPGSAGADARGCVAGAPPCSAAEQCAEATSSCRPAGCAEPDQDGDGYAAVGCDGTDCDDDDPNRFPGNEERCDSSDHDEDCDPTTFGVRDADDDGWPDAACCNEAADGSRACGDDCDDVHAGVHPTESEGCDGLDNDCDDAIDEEVTRTFYADVDGDSYGDPEGETMLACEAPERFSDDHTDCDDGEAARHPGAPETCDSIDNDCDASIDESLPTVSCYPDADGDGAPVSGAAVPACGCPAGSAQMGAAWDCADDEARAFPAQTAYFATAYSRRMGGLIISSFDYDCSGALERPPIAPCALGLIGTCPAGSEGPRRNDVGCGTPVEWLRCNADCTSVSLGDMPLGCR